MAIHELGVREGRRRGAVGRGWGCWVSTAQPHRICTPEAHTSSHPHVHKAHVFSPRSILQPRLQRGIKQVPGEVCFGCSEANKQASKQANKTQYLPLNSICCLYFMEELIKKYALGFGDPSFCSKRASFPVCGCFILGHHRKSLCSHPQKFWVKKDSWLLFSFPYDTVAIIKGWIFLDVSPYSKKPRVPSFKSSKV